jgi:hypothetical protein
MKDNENKPFEVRRSAALKAFILSIIVIIVYWQVFSHSNAVQQIYTQSRFSYAALSVTLTATCGALLGFLADCISRALGWEIKRVEDAEVEIH